MKAFLKREKEAKYLQMERKKKCLFSFNDISCTGNNKVTDEKGWFRAGSDSLLFINLKLKLLKVICFGHFIEDEWSQSRPHKGPTKKKLQLVWTYVNVCDSRSHPFLRAHALSLKRALHLSL